VARAARAVEPARQGPVGSEKMGRKWSNTQAVSKPKVSISCQRESISCQEVCCCGVWMPKRIGCAASVILPPVPIDLLLHFFHCFNVSRRKSNGTSFALRDLHGALSPCWRSEARRLGSVRTLVDCRSG